jgi:hypothetical protein
LGSGGFQIDGAETWDWSGSSVASAGDMNGDGYADVMVGAYRADRLSRTDAGSSYVIYGQPAQMSIDLAMPLGSGALQVEGPAAGALGGVAAPAGDVNGDGRPDMIVGAPYADPLARTDAGSSYVVYGFGSARVSYPGPITATVGTPLADVAPTVRRTGSATFSVSPALPQGLTLNTATGVISGIPAQASSGTYAVRMTDLSGAAGTTVSITANAAAAPVRRPALLRARMSCRGGVCTTSGRLPARAVRIAQSGRARGKKAVRSRCRISTTGRGTTARRTFICVLPVTRGRWTITTSARAKDGTTVARSVVTRRLK